MGAIMRCLQWLGVTIDDWDCICVVGGSAERSRKKVGAIGKPKRARRRGQLPLPKKRHESPTRGKKTSPSRTKDSSPPPRNEDSSSPPRKNESPPRKSSSTSRKKEA